MKYKLYINETQEYNHEVELEFDGSFDELDNIVDELDVDIDLDDIVYELKQKGCKNVVPIEDTSGTRGNDYDELEEMEEEEEN